MNDEDWLKKRRRGPRGGCAMFVAMVFGAMLWLA